MTGFTEKRESFATRLGQSLGRGVGSMLRVERSVWSTMSSTGLSPVIVTPVKWIARAIIVFGGVVLAAWGLLYVLAVLAMAAIVIGLMTSPFTENVLRGSSVDDADPPYGSVTNVFGQTKDSFEADSEYR
jgi:hypothetical protein